MCCQRGGHRASSNLALLPWPAMTLISGIPTAEAYASCVASPLFEDMERYSDAFLKWNRAHLLWYSIRWSEDPLNHPTRRWEYPYVYDRLAGTKAQHLLDAGSGVTFFPYFLMESNPDLTVTCCDRDAYIGKLYNKINRNQARKVAFQQCNLSVLPFPDRTFDGIYCISVLEHTGNWEAIVQEFRRVLKPGGRLIVTFDVSLDGKQDIPVSAAEKLLSFLSSNLQPLNSPPLDIARSDIYLSDLGAGMAQGLSFWRLYRTSLRAAKAMIGTGSLRPSHMTVYCGQFACPEQAK